VTAELPERGDLVVVLWPDGDYDFEIQFQYAEPVDATGWRVLSGSVIKPEGVQHRGLRSFYVKPVDPPRKFTLHPKLL